MNRTTPLIAVSLIAGAFTGPLLIGSTARAPRALEPIAQGGLHAAKSHDVESVRITPVVLAVRKAGPSVVSIQVGEGVPVRGGERFAKLGDGSGVIVSKEGLVLTNWHVIRFKDRVRRFRCRVRLRDGSVFPAKVLNTSPTNDLALLLVTPDKGHRNRFPPIAMGDSSTLMVGETVIAIGNPRGQDNTVTTGVLSAVNRSMSVTPRGERRPIRFKELLQTDAAINPGNSGGALLDITGKLIGINTLMQVESQNIGFAIPVNHVRKVFERDLLNVSDLGVWTGLDIAETEAGLVVASVVPGGPADRANVRRGDRVIAIGSKQVKSKQDFAKALITFAARGRVPLLVSANGRRVRRDIVGWDRDEATVYKLSGLFANTADSYRDRTLYRKLGDAIWDVYRWDGRGLAAVRVVTVQPNSPASKLGLQKDDVIVGLIDGRGYLQPLTNGVRELAAYLSSWSGRSAPQLSVYRSGEGLLRGTLELRSR